MDFPGPVQNMLVASFWPAQKGQTCLTWPNRVTLSPSKQPIHGWFSRTRTQKWLESFCFFLFKMGPQRGALKKNTKKQIAGIAILGDRIQIYDTFSANGSRCETAAGETGATAPMTGTDDWLHCRLKGGSWQRSSANSFVPKPTLGGFLLPC